MRLTAAREGDARRRNGRRCRSSRCSTRSRSAISSAREDFVAGHPGAHHGRHREPGRGGRAPGWRSSPRPTGGRAARVRIPTITDPRGTDFTKAELLKQADWMLDLERRAIDAFVKLGVIDDRHLHQLPDGAGAPRAASTWPSATRVWSSIPTRCAARAPISRAGRRRSSAGLTGRTPRYGFHLDRAAAGDAARARRTGRPITLNDWGALGGVIGRLAGNYWAVPVVEGIDRAPTSDELKHFGAAMASFGSIALFHMRRHHAGGVAPRRTWRAPGLPERPRRPRPR